MGQRGRGFEGEEFKSSMVQRFNKFKIEKEVGEIGKSYIR